MIRYLQESEKRLSRPLYEEVFGDTEKFTDFYYNTRVGGNAILADMQDGSVVSMLHRCPRSLTINGKEVESEYVFAVATSLEHRRSGRMGALMRRALCDMNSAGLPLAYLAPVDYKVYLPYGFACVYSAYGCMEKNKYVEATGYNLVAAQEADIEELVGFSDKLLHENLRMYSSRNFEYYSNMIQQLEAENGFLAILKNNQGICAYGYLSNDESLQISEFVCLPMARDAYISAVCNRMGCHEIRINGVLFPWDGCEDQPKVMARVIRPEALTSYIRTKEKINLCLKLNDPVIRENNNTFIIKSDAFSCSIRKSASSPDLEMDIETFSKWLTTGLAMDGLPDLVGNKGVFLNEIV
ncbi:GNAT family N-acetyltransferase [Parasporobacterium paucivorans]|uniref:Predicted acetyltransferase n=1 Tax=Parasporobacterium paucivorans DSM 15970 TaxID=1122934 RepID=A0A1M6FQ86_9FIRM|nr:GNAT family N-acetyltransferase [Parasporobacterium paucivorans]SHI99928.1 Predicted acetyltransferase [Parasporobacterium paucivorans DSM 15970]